MGGRGTSTGRTGGLTGQVTNIRSLISEREGRPGEVDDTLRVLRDIEDTYDVTLNDVQVVKMRGNTMAYYDIDGNLAVSEKYFDEAGMNAAYDRGTAAGFHPSRGGKSGMEATVAHEAGHRLTDMAGIYAGYGPWELDRVANEIVAEAATRLGISHAKVRQGVSGYGESNNAEAIAEAFSDVYCNGEKASRESRTLVNILNRRLRGGGTRVSFV